MDQQKGIYIALPSAWENNEPYQSLVAQHQSWTIAFLAQAKTITRQKPFAFKLSVHFWSRLSVKLDYSPYRTCSRGGYSNGKAHISLSPHINAIKGNSLGTFKEYVALSGSSIIGSCRGNAKVRFMCLLAHELAHCIQYYARCNRAMLRDEKINRAGLTYDVLKKPHGQGFQEIYRGLRIKLVNTLETYQSVNDTQ